mmetsp:Transcript_3390/g.6269  ORF Transcript_3390/g.6269 Transcript_3390/m.6269 type:complete len:101 (+) Transcript_3390:1261-1563(+)|eukprot:CAMPEP_0113303212 /NCGR_PEP_ID=MMETSP0010_2-20120614/3725_1 /TAXON_ID=216773 ORGANISM="Corethron hystrix, Strain 308" /NCGR_SAMPLE_ID=MMETSP0010_2 /ASSEMBLY_ACC=CAM_ASM_000155 /LENGTH=100 /DNA_ID=CAMNT_0000157177 /DNA_START=1052 /DNA_END=1354 /DNA_ORIENTATION=- /assembly_acc=CAM_ASM_000155
MRDEADTSSHLSLPKTSDDTSVSVITLLIAIEGDSTASSLQDAERIMSKASVRQILDRISSDGVLDEYLMSCEIMWAPEGENEILTKRDAVASYPRLVPI